MFNIFKILAFTKKFWKWYVFMGIFVIAVSFLNLAVPILSKQVVDLIVLQISGVPQNFSKFFQILILIIIADVSMTVLTVISQWIGDMLTVRLQTYLSKRFYEHLLSLHIGFYDNEITGRIVNKMYRGITSITEFIQNMLNNFLPFFLTALVTIILLSWYSWVIALLLALLFPIYIVISHGSTIAWGKYEQKKNSIQDLSQGRVFESISGIRVVKAFAAEMQELTSFLTSRKSIEELTLKQTGRWHLYDFFRRFALNIIMFAIYSYIVYWTFQKRYTIGEMTLLLQLVQQARFPLFAMSFILGQIQQANSGSQDFFSLLKTKSEIIDSHDANKLVLPKNTPNRKAFIEFQNISFQYEKSKKVLQNLSFQIFGKEKFALVGASGEGKSTIVNLLLRFYQPQSGRIYINKQDISDVTFESLHKNIAIVFQESLLFSGTIYENIAYAIPKASKKNVLDAAVAANADEFIKELPNGYESLIGERGVKLSGGQKQRIAIARAMLKNAPIIVLDEATSSLDSRSELLVQEGLERLLHDRTAIIIAHRLSTIAHADHILVIEGGSVVQYGSPRQLLTDGGGLYAQLVKLQKQLLEMPEEEKQTKLQQYDLVG